MPTHPSTPPTHPPTTNVPQGTSHARAFQALETTRNKTHAPLQSGVGAQQPGSSGAGLWPAGGVTNALPGSAAAPRVSPLPCVLPCPAAGVSLVKFDNCFAHDDLLGRFVAMRDALNATGRPIVYMLCEWVSDRAKGCSTGGGGGPDGACGTAVACST